jgi:hypothetical protein
LTDFPVVKRWHQGFFSHPMSFKLRRLADRVR